MNPVAAGLGRLGTPLVGLIAAGEGFSFELEQAGVQKGAE
jgi:hypothetical protein